MPHLSHISLSKLPSSEVVLYPAVSNPDRIQVPKHQELIITTIIVLPVCDVLSHLLDGPRPS